MLLKGSVYWATNSLLRSPVWSRTQKRMRQSSGTLMLKFMSASQQGVKAVNRVKQVITVSKWGLNHHQNPNYNDYDVL